MTRRLWLPYLVSRAAGQSSNSRECRARSRQSKSSKSASQSVMKSSPRTPWYCMSAKNDLNGSGRTETEWTTRYSRGHLRNCGRARTDPASRKPGGRQRRLNKNHSPASCPTRGRPPSSPRPTVPLPMGSAGSGKRVLGNQTRPRISPLPARSRAREPRAEAQAGPRRSVGATPSDPPFSIVGGPAPASGASPRFILARRSAIPEKFVKRRGCHHPMDVHRAPHFDIRVVDHSAMQ